jgi:peptide deformylase
MDALRIVKLGGEILREKTLPVKRFGDELRATTEAMIKLMDGKQGVGLAAPQVGIRERFFVVHVKNDVPRTFVNPSIIETSLDTCKFEEGCLSLSGIYADVVRASTIKLQAFDVRGKPFRLDCAGILARVIQHEIDHLDGILFIDHLSADKQKRLVDKYEKIEKRLMKPQKRKPSIFR